MTELCIEEKLLVIEQRAATHTIRSYIRDCSLAADRLPRVGDTMLVLAAEIVRPPVAPRVEAVVWEDVGTKARLTLRWAAPTWSPDHDRLLAEEGWRLEGAADLPNHHRRRLGLPKRRSSTRSAWPSDVAHR